MARPDVNSGRATFFLCNAGGVADEDPPRLLHRRLEAGYTDKPMLAAAGEPEAVDAETQEQLTRQSQRREDSRRNANWHEIRGQLQATIDEIARAFGTVASEELRDFRRGIDRLNRKLR
jgi:hypothetical protein